ncbi:hypothetical protein WA1_10590 [Scytonema hofmannii PCC 7110]|uniref:DUF1830 domain-containing protein n=1 Tax=Scytonema hofmannii PCC 7110 TaxID=128403 RepID=A0A139XFR4_9CYAN|nr:hypothetical protein WA1_10590 [Scytonema hofmannii PCC 7110]
MTAQLLAPPSSSRSNQILCCYVNFSNQVQVARIDNIPNWYFERVVFPGQRLLFETPANAQLEIHTGTMASAIQSDCIWCQSLQVHNSKRA